MYFNVDRINDNKVEFVELRTYLTPISVSVSVWYVAKRTFFIAIRT